MLVCAPKLGRSSTCNVSAEHLNPESVALITIQRRFISPVSPGLKRHTGAGPRKWNARFRLRVVSVRDHSGSCRVLQSAAGSLRTAEVSEAA